MIAVFGQDEMVGEWAERQIAEPFCPPFTAIGFSRDGETLHGAAIFNQWNGANIEISIVAPGCMTRSAIRTVYTYVFDQIKATRLTARTARWNKAMQRLLPRLGFEWEGVAQKFYGPERKDDAIMYRLTPEAARKFLTRKTVH